MPCHRCGATLRVRLYTLVVKSVCPRCGHVSFRRNQDSGIYDQVRIERQSTMAGRGGRASQRVRR